MNSSATAFDAWSGLLSVASYLIVGIAAFASAPRDTRARVFLVVAFSSVLPYALPALMWWNGGSVAQRPSIVTGVAVSLAAGGVALFHFMQVFPRRRPFIQSRGVWIAGCYAVLPLLAAATGLLLSRVLVAASASGDPYVGDAYVPIDVMSALGLLVIGMPTILIVGVVLPFAGLMSLYKSWQDARREGRSDARVTTFWMLISQLAGGVLTILIVPVLHFAAPTGPWVTIASALLFGFGLLMPVAFAVAVWKYRLLPSR